MDAPYRASTPPSLGLLRCLYCGTPRPSSFLACQSCGADSPSVPCHACSKPVIEPAASCACGAPSLAWNEPDDRNMPCPRCHKALARMELDIASVRVEQCARCLGSFVRTRHFSELLDRETAGEAVGLHRFVPLAPGKELPQETLLAPAACPHCGREMDRVRFAQRASLVVDVCPTHGIWTDATELVSVVSFVKNRMTGEVPLGEAELADKEKWDRISARVAEEERVVNELADRAEQHIRDRGNGEGGPGRWGVKWGGGDF
jgi:Zn-finger nucleic acid-binding protein